MDDAEIQMVSNKLIKLNLTIDKLKGDDNEKTDFKDD